MTQTVSLSFFRFGSLSSRIWAFAMMGLARGRLARTPRIGFWKLFGSGTGEGFTPIPNTAVYAILATWPDETSARHGVTQTPVFQNYANRADEAWTIYLRPASVRGDWSGKQPFQPYSEPFSGPLAALTRASVKPSAVLKFWRRVPNISAVIGSDANVRFKIGIGEVPFLHQVTFSIWPDTQSMAAFARADGPHARAIRAVREGNWFHEELYARFAVLGDGGTWNGISPLTEVETAP